MHLENNKGQEPERDKLQTITGLCRKCRIYPTLKHYTTFITAIYRALRSFTRSDSEYRKGCGV